MRRTVNLGIASVALLALPIALAAQWATAREAKQSLDSGRQTIVDASPGPPPIASVADELKIYPSF